MNDYAVYIKAALSAAGTAVLTLLGWKGILVFAWVAAMAVDYASGTAAAWTNGKWSSSVARQGLWHKCGMVCAVLVAGIADGVLSIDVINLELGITWPGLILPLVLTWYVLTELGSILENAAAMGAKIPTFLTKALAIAQDFVDSHTDGDDDT